MARSSSYSDTYFVEVPFCTGLVLVRSLCMRCAMQILYFEYRVSTPNRARNINMIIMLTSIQMIANTLVFETRLARGDFSSLCRLCIDYPVCTPSTSVCPAYTTDIFITVYM